MLGYIRCSTLEQSADGLSLDTQRSRIEAWCEATGSDLTEVIQDAGVSGSRPLRDRPNGCRIAEMLVARRPEVDAVVVLRLDRLGRDAAETLALLRQFARGQVGLVSIADRVDLNSAQGRAMAQMSAVFAELERALIGQRTAESLARLKAEGRSYGPTPFGVRSVKGHLVADDDEQRTLRRIRRARSRGGSYQQIASSLNRSKVAAKRGGSWHAMSVRSVLKTTESLGIAL